MKEKKFNRGNNPICSSSKSNKFFSSKCLIITKCYTICIPESFNMTISHQLFDYRITFVRLAALEHKFKK